MNNLISKLIGLAQAPALWPLITLGVMPAMEHRRAFAGRKYELVIDAGANKGQFGAFAAWRWPGAHIMCVEPLEAPRKTLTSVLEICAGNRSSIQPIALGDMEGNMTIHIATRDDSSSLRPLGELQKNLFSMHEAETQTVTVRRLDNIVQDIDTQQRTLLKIDVQGFEYELLKGGMKTLDQIDAIYVELSYVELYVGQKLADDVTRLLSDAGFKPTFRRVSSYKANAPVQADVLFERT